MVEQNEDWRRTIIAAARYDQLTDKNLQDILDIYDEVAFGRKIDRDDYRIYYLKERRDERKPAEFRFGSRLTMHSKLWMRRCYGDFDEDVLAFDMTDNLGRDPSKREEREGREMEKSFRTKVYDYLLSNNLLFTHESLKY